MELVYLWVEEYKNIKRQGFNFSPRFTCEYDEEKNELTIDKNNDDIENFFGDNINITAIVGKNGSGKSSILETLIILMDNNNKDYRSQDRFCAVFYQKNFKKYYTKNVNHDIIIFDQDDTTEDLQVEEYNTFTFHFNYSLDFIYEERPFHTNNAIYHKTDDYDNPILLQPDKSDYKINLINIDYLATKDMLNFILRKNIDFQKINNFFIPKYFKLTYNLEKIHKNRPSNNQIFYKKMEVICESNFELNDNPSLIDYEKLKTLTYIYIIQKTYEKEILKTFDFVYDKNYKILLKECTKDISKLDKVISYIENKKFTDLYDNSLNYKVEKIHQSFLFIEFLRKQDSDYRLPNNKQEIFNNKDLIDNLVPWIDIELFNSEHISYYFLSYGQKFLIKFIYSLLNQLNNLTSFPKYKNIVILLDEVELGLHPQWQKEYISFLTDVLSMIIEGFDFKYNIICSTHSPFILSDLPKGNVIFLKDGKNVTDDTKINPFGANIHTLLSDGFFMDDGLMGEFAKGKINEIIDFHNLVKKAKNHTCLKKIYQKSKQKKFWEIQSIIGEEYLKQVVKNHLRDIENILLGHDEAKQEEITRLRDEADRLEKM